MQKKHLNWILVIGWMVVIFMFSCQVGNVSDENNKFVIYVFNLLGLNLNNILGSLTNFIIRKASHFTEYFILYMLIFRAINKSKKLDIKLLIGAILIVFLYACSDEFHQAFVPGRSPAFRDVMVDTCGGFTAFLYIYIRTILKNKSASPNKVMTKFK